VTIPETILIPFIRVLLATAWIAVLAGCAAPVVLQPEVPILGPELDAHAAVPGETKVMFFNNSNKLLFGIDNTGKVGVWINGKGLAVLQIGDYVQVSLPRGRQAIELAHVDIGTFRSAHDLMVGEEPLYVEVYATAMSNEMKVFQSLPANNYLPLPLTPYRRQ
jgi:hypothetical protein